MTLTYTLFILPSSPRGGDNVAKTVSLSHDKANSNFGRANAGFDLRSYISYPLYYNRTLGSYHQNPSK